MTSWLPPIQRRQSTTTITETQLTTLQLTIIYNSKLQTGQWQCEWSINDDSVIIKAQYHTEKWSKYHGNKRGNLIAIYQALTYIINAHRELNCVPLPRYLTIVSNKTGLGKTLRMLQYGAVTISNMTKSEAELSQQLIKLLKLFPGHRFRSGKCEQYNQPMETIEGSGRFQMRFDPLISIYLRGDEATGDLQEAIKTEATRNAYQEYLTEKHEWSPDTFEQIDWESFKIAIRGTKHCTIAMVIKFIHGWLPTRGHPGYTSETTKIDTCPFCIQQTETNAHFIECKSGNK
jgi:hypothetical protein